MTNLLKSLNLQTFMKLKLWYDFFCIVIWYAHFCENFKMVFILCKNNLFRNISEIANLSEIEIAYH